MCVCVRAHVSLNALYIAGEFQCRSGIWSSEDQGFKCLLHCGWGPGALKKNKITKAPNSGYNLLIDNDDDDDDNCYLRL